MNETPDYLDGMDDGFGGRIQDLLPVAFVEATSAPVSSGHLAFSAPNDWSAVARKPTQALPNGKIGDKIQQGLDWAKEHGQDIVTVASEIITPGSTGYQTERQQQKEQNEKSKAWSNTEIALAAGGVAVAGLALYLLFSKTEK